jgi:F-type H+-transporting ATPase subunit c
MLELMDFGSILAEGMNIELNDKAFGMLGGVIGAGLIVMGAAKGIGDLAGKATEAIARQPEMGGRIFTTMIIAAALIEGVTLFALIICLLAVV